jgi:hypothetical protein
MMLLLWFGLHQTATGFEGNISGKVREAAKDQHRVNGEADEVDLGSDLFLSCFVKASPIANFVDEVHLRELSVLAGNRGGAVVQPAVASLAAWDKTTSKVHGLKVGAWYACAGGCYNYSPYQIVNVANGSIEGDSTQIVVTMNL